jgi:DNA-binding MarR family transcriptional regulator
MKKELSSRDSLGFWMYRAHSQASNLLRRTFQAHGYDVTPEQWGVLRSLRHAEGVNQSQLGENTFKDRHNITRILGLLEKRGLVERRIDEGDKRAYRVFLTEAGRKEQDALQGLVDSHQETLLNGLKREEVASLWRIFEHIVRNIERKG